MKRLVLIDGVRFAPADAKVSVYDRGFLYGDSVFETVRTYAGELFALEEHVARLERSADQVGIPVPISAEQMAAETRRAVTDVDNDESYARIMVTRGSGPIGLDTGLAADPLRVIIVEPLTMPPADHYRRGISVKLVETVRAADAASGAKLGNYLASAMALREAQRAGAEEALVVNRDGLVVESTTSNVFAVTGGALVTPPLGVGILAGITRGVVLELAADAGIEIRYRALSPAELLDCDEVFLTSSIRELMPVARIDGLSVGRGEPGEVTRRLHLAFRQRVGLKGVLPWVPGED